MEKERFVLAGSLRVQPSGSGIRWQHEGAARASSEIKKRREMDNGCVTGFVIHPRTSSFGPLFMVSRLIGSPNPASVQSPLLI